MERDIMEYDVVVVGGGPSGLACAIRLMQCAQEKNRTISVCVVEKGSEIGAHILSGAVLDPRALNTLIPDWKEKGAPLNTPVTHEQMRYLSRTSSLPLPILPQMKNHGNYIISLGALCRWLGAQAEALGVQIFPGFPAADVVIEDGVVKGIITGDFGVAKNGEKKDSYQPGVFIKAHYTVFAEGCRGSISETLMKTFELRKACDPQTYGIGIKELWEVLPEKHRPGSVTHTVGWPLDTSTYGGSFMYHLDNNQVAIGMVIGLDYSNPYLDPFLEFQRFKHHDAIRPLLEGGRRISYGARALNEGGLQSIPKLTMPGAVLVGCAAGLLNVPKIKGTHTSMQSGMFAAEAIALALEDHNCGAELVSYPRALKNSWVYDELSEARNIRPAFHWGLWLGLLYAAIDSFLLRGKAPWTLRNRADHTSLALAKESVKIDYPRPDGVISFDRMSSVFLSATHHEENQPVHLKLKDPHIPVAHNLALYDAPEQRYCPAGVYEMVQDATGPIRLQINAQNCVHCKTCDIKDPTQNIVWVVPEGGGGPNYGGM